MEVTGKIIQSLPEQSGTSQSGKAWKKKEYILETLENYPRKICITFFGEKVDQFPLEVGLDYTISIDIESREYNGRWFTNINGYKAQTAVLTTAGTQFQQPAAQAAPQFISGAAMPPSPPAVPQTVIPQTTVQQSASDELPF